MSVRLVAAIGCGLALLAMAAPSGAAGLELPRGDGWYSWAVEASATGAKSCCYGWHGGQAVTRKACDLDEKRGGYTLGGDCVLESDRVRVYVRIVDGEASRIRALNADCPVTTSSEITDLGEIDAADSVGWLAAGLGDGRHQASERLAAITMHAGETSFLALKDVVEDRGRPLELREQALFWLAQSDDDEAFDYLDGLLSRR